MVTSRCPSDAGAPLRDRLLLCGLTLGLCQASSDLATSRYFSRRIRAFVADFGPAGVVAVVSALSMTRGFRLLAEVPRLALPEGAVRHLSSV